MAKATDFDLYLMVDDEVNSVSSFEASRSTDGENDRAKTNIELSQSDEATTDYILDEMTDLKASATKPSDPLGHLQAELSSFTTKVANLESSPAKKVADKLEESVP
ncbi:hypothetical protein Tco_0310813 [Tanacetum coccineum]